MIGTALGTAVAGALLGPALGALAGSVGTEPVSPEGQAGRQGDAHPAPPGLGTSVRALVVRSTAMAAVGQATEAHRPRDAIESTTENREGDA